MHYINILNIIKKCRKANITKKKHIINRSTHSIINSICTSNTKAAANLNQSKHFFKANSHNN